MTNVIFFCFTAMTFVRHLLSNLKLVQFSFVSFLVKIFDVDIMISFCLSAKICSSKIYMISRRSDH